LWAGRGAGTETGNDSCGNKGTRECRKYCGSNHNSTAPEKSAKNGAKNKGKALHFRTFTGVSRE